MKRIVFLTCCIALLATSCVKNPKPIDDPVDPVVADRLTTVETFNVPTKPNSTTIVSFGCDTLCFATEPTTIWIPKGSNIDTKADGQTIQISYIDGTDPRAGSAQMWQTIGFEDSETGDYDYNDLVIHVKNETKNGKFGVGVHPIALGSTKNIALGCKIYLEDELLFDGLLTDNCRRDLFDNQAGFINTDKVANFHTNYFRVTKTVTVPAKTNISKVFVIWYIQVGEKIYYAVNHKYGFLDANKRPYGLLLTNTGNTFYQDEKDPIVGGNWFAYPFEAININSAYPGFDDWIEGKTQECDMHSPVPNMTIDLDSYKYNRKEGPTRVYYCVKEVL